MPTISDLVAAYSKVPGDIKVTSGGGRIFTPFFKSGIKEPEYWYGLDQNGEARTEHVSYIGWMIYTEPEPKPKVLKSQIGDTLVESTDDGKTWVAKPKPKVMRAQYLYVPHGGFYPLTSVRWFKDDDDFTSVVNHHGAAIIMRLEEREFER